MTIICKNTSTESDLSIYIRSGKRISIPKDDGYGSSTKNLLNEATRDELASANDFAFHIQQGNVTINDGIKDLDWLSALDLVRGYNQKLATNDAGRVVTIVEPNSGTSVCIVTHNFCDPCTWFEQSVRETGLDGYGEVLTTDGYYLTYSSNNDNWIDLTHGRYNGEDIISSSYVPIITVNDVQKTEDTDFIVNYEDGYITFNEALTENDTIKAIYSYQNGSRFTIGPNPGTKLRLLYTEVQFSTDVNISSSLSFRIFVYNPYDLPNKVQYGNADTYKSARDFVDKANGGSRIPAFGEINSDIVILPFNYVTTKDLLSSQGTEVRIEINNNIPLQGQFATMSAYCLVEAE